MDPATSSRPDERGFTLVEVMIATVVMLTGLLSVAYGIGIGLAVVQTSTEDMVAREKARETMEDVFTARDTASITFSQICNLPGTGCIFVSGLEPLYTPGPDGIVNTADDGTETPLPTGCSAAPCIEMLDTPGPDGILGTTDDIFVPLTNFQRSIQVTQISTVLVQVTVTIQYTTPKGLSRSVTMVALMSPYV
jgi:prepilin-type N-terminal cleavage/methylation domain-containing protein